VDEAIVADSAAEKAIVVLAAGVTVVDAVDDASSRWAVTEAVGVLTVDGNDAANRSRTAMFTVGVVVPITAVVVFDNLLAMPIVAGETEANK